ncbi:MAG: tetratricopeptide repeat protein [Pseudobdellovibrionaceae bacterium]
MEVQQNFTESLITTPNSPMRPPVSRANPRSAPAQAPSDELGVLLINVQEMIRVHDYKSAEQLLIRILFLDSCNLLALKWTYQIHLARKNFPQCLVIARNIQKIKYDFSSCLRMANLQYQLGNDQIALDSYFEALSVLGTEDVELFSIYKNIGNIYARFEDFDGAEEYYNKAHTLNTNSDILYVNFGTLALQKNDVEKAKQCFHRAIELNQKNSQAWTGLGMIYHQQADFDLAWANVRQGFDFNHQNKIALQLICQWSLHQGKSDEAVICCLQYLDQNEFDKDVSGWLVEQFAANQNFGSALLETEKLRAFCPEMSPQLLNVVSHFEQQCEQRSQWI